MTGLFKRRSLKAAALALTACAGLMGCNRVGLLNALTLNDRGATRVAHDVPYGEGERRMLDVYAPNDGAENAPVIVFIYGGGWSWGRRQDYAFVGHALAARGFVTVVADYRLTPDVVFPAFVEDVAAAVAWTHRSIADHGGDPGAIYLVGHSAGAYNVVMTALDERYLEAAGVDSGVVAGVAGLSGPYDFLPLDTASSIAAFSAAPDLAATQPVNFARADAPPMLLITGTDDDTVRPRNTEALAAALTEAGASVETVLYPGAGHAATLTGFSRTLRGASPVLDDVASFFRRIHDLRREE